MLTKEPGPERAKLGFREAVLSSFGFLADYGLHPVEEQVTFVRYESSEVFLNVYHGRASFELGVEIGRLEQPTAKLTHYDIIAWAGVTEAEGFGKHVSFQVSSRGGVQEFVPKLATLIKKHAAPLLSGDSAAYDSALAIQSELAEEYGREANLGNLHSKAAAAWKAKDYSQVVELYNSIRKDLNEVEAKKLAYAEQQLSTVEGT